MTGKQTGYSIVAYMVAKDPDTDEILGYGSAYIPDPTFRNIEDKSMAITLRYLLEDSGGIGEYGIGILDHENQHLIVKHSDLPPHECEENDDPNALGVAPATVPEDDDPQDSEDASKIAAIMGIPDERIMGRGNPSTPDWQPTADDLPEESLGNLKPRGE